MNMDMRTSSLFTALLILIGAKYTSATENETPTDSPSHNTCKPWCANNPNPWRDPDPERTQKCDWLINCAGCEECLRPTYSPSSPPSTLLPCLPWCANHEAPWTDPDPEVSQKCKWRLKCAGCPQCLEINSTSIPSSSPQLSSAIPSLSSTLEPSIYEPTSIPSHDFNSLSLNPSNSPSGYPTNIITEKPSTEPSMDTLQQSLNPSITPTKAPIIEQSNIPSISSSTEPSVSTNHPSHATTDIPSSIRTTYPSQLPSYFPSESGTIQPSMLPTYISSNPPTTKLSNNPTSELSFNPTKHTSFAPTSNTSLFPSSILSLSPSNIPTTTTTLQPSLVHTRRPSTNPSENLSHQPIMHPTGIPSKYSTSKPSNKPTLYQTLYPSDTLSATPTFHPSETLSSTPTLLPSNFPSNHKSSMPSFIPTHFVSLLPSNFPTATPSTLLTHTPTMSQISELPSYISSSPSGISSTSPTIFSTIDTFMPSFVSSTIPSNKSSERPSSLTSSPSNYVSSIPSSKPTLNLFDDFSTPPTSYSSSYPSNTSSLMPSLKSTDSATSSSPSNVPSSTISSIPSLITSTKPSEILSPAPTVSEADFQSALPSSSISGVPTISKSHSPIKFFSVEPSNGLSLQPSHIFSTFPTNTVIPFTYPSSSPSVHKTLVPTLSVSVFPSDIQVPTPSPSRDTCKAWCYNKPEPWRDPDSSVIQKCDWKKNCGSCPECLEPVPPSSSPPCKAWCKDNSAPWTHPNPDVRQKCRWWENCSGCPQCEAPSVSPTMNQSFRPSIIFSDVPSLFLSGRPTSTPSTVSTERPTTKPSVTENPTFVPTTILSKKPTLNPTKLPTFGPTENSSSIPSMHPSKNAIRHTSTPSLLTLPPTNWPTLHPTRNSDSDKSPTIIPSTLHSLSPSVDVSSFPSGYPSNLSTNPSHYLSPNPTETPTMNATVFISIRGDSEMTDETKKIFERVTKDFLSNSSLSTDTATVSIIGVNITDQIVIQYISDESLQLLSNNEFNSLVGKDNRRLQSPESFLLLEVVIYTEVVTTDDSSPFSLESKIQESMENTLEDYKEELNTAQVWQGIIERNSLKIESNDTLNDLDDPLISTTVVVGGVVGFVMLGAGFILLRRYSKRGYNPEKNILPNVNSTTRVATKKATADPPEIDDKYHAEVMPRSINLSSQDSFSTLTFREYKDGTLIPQREDSSLFKKEGSEQWKTPLAFISESVSTDDKSNESQPFASPALPMDENESLGGSNQHEDVTSTYYKESPSSSISNSSEKKDFADYLASGKSLLEIQASPGPLGLVVRSSEEGPVVCEISPNSALAGLCELDDIILSVNDVDTRSMSTIAFAQYMTENEQLPKRIITVLRSEIVGNPDELMSL